MKVRMAKLVDLRDKRVKGELAKYTKKEQLDMDKELVSLEKFFGGVESLDKLPSMMFIADLSENEYAAKEARLKKIPVMGFLNTDTNPNLIDHAIPCNDRNIASIKLVMDYLVEAALEGKKQAKSKVGEIESKEEKAK